jgi:hypothetical protein
MKWAHDITPNFVKISLGIRKLMRGDTEAHRHTDSKVISLVYFHFFKIEHLGYKGKEKVKLILCLTN